MSVATREVSPSSLYSFTLTAISSLGPWGIPSIRVPTNLTPNRLTNIAIEKRNPTSSHIMSLCVRWSCSTASHHYVVWLVECPFLQHVTCATSSPARVRMMTEVYFSLEGYSLVLYMVFKILSKKIVKIDKYYSARSVVTPSGKTISKKS